jgi:hypothetical protein
LTGTETNPNEIVADPMDLAAMVYGVEVKEDIPAESGHRKNGSGRQPGTWG